MAWQRMAHPRGAPSRATFVDLSSNNPGGVAALNAREYSSAGHLLVALKSTEGETYVNPDWGPQVNDAHAHRLGVLHYHFLRPDQGTSPTLEARHFWNTVRGGFNRRVDRIAFDLEVGNQAGWPAFLAEFDRELYRFSTIEAIGYTFASANLAELVIRSRKWWLASWGTHQPSGAFRRLPGRQTLWAWQYTNGTVDPSGGAVRVAGANEGAPLDVSVLNPATVRSLKQHLRR